MVQPSDLVDERQLLVAELGGNFERFSAEVEHDLRNMTSWIMNEVRGHYGDWLGQHRHFEALLSWKEDFFARYIPRLDEMAQDFLSCRTGLIRVMETVVMLTLQTASKGVRGLASPDPVLDALWLWVCWRPSPT